MIVKGTREFEIDFYDPRVLVHTPCGERVEVEGSTLADAIATAMDHRQECEPEETPDA